ncbi:hypothetical protein THAOC_27669 [Thalassiosira oceanica]|uniref:MORN repeat-containing protein 5 n=1 Tax=Thalassiosira oceanica TaxID=159749 RepID=K0RIB0_THAOC|nr:hypothetical protein THAOC_27669 [Thalassiosira oceanica]|eukprot:EJK52980.1 hypothetical protein THAOC_27669 [Thalassiosira oceanica]
MRESLKTMACKDLARSPYDGCEIEGEFAHGKLVQGTITNGELTNGGTYTGVFDVGGLREGKITFPPEGRNGEVKKEGVFVDGRLNGHGKITYADGGIIKGTFVDGYIHAGTDENVKCDDGNIYRVRLLMVYQLGLGQPGNEIKATKRRFAYRLPIGPTGAASLYWPREVEGTPLAPFET